VLNPFKKKHATEEISTLAAKLVGAYADRTFLTFRLFGLDPTPTAEEMAVFWAASCVGMDEDRSWEASDFGIMLHDTAAKYFDSHCQNYISVIGKSGIKLDMDSEEIKKLVGSVLSALSKERASALTQVFGELRLNSVPLAYAAISWLRLGLDPKTASSTLDQALKLVLATRGMSDEQAFFLKQDIASVLAHR